MSEWLVKVNDVSFRYGMEWIVHKVNVQISEGEIIGIRGANGSGKSTILRLIAQFLSPQKGKIDYNEQWGSLKSWLGVVLSEHYLYDDLTVLENLRFYGQLYRVPTSQLEIRIDKLLVDYQLESKRDQFPYQLSKGYKQRVSLVRSLLHQPKLLLLDEPFDGLDLNSQSILIEAIGAFRANNNSIILVSHDLSLLQKLSTTCYEMSEKKLICVLG